MSVSTPTEALDIQDFQFKLLCRLQVFHAEENLGAPAVNLVATASKYGLIFVGCPSSIQVLQSSSLVKLGSSAVTGEVSEYPRREVPLPSRPSHFAVSCDQSYLVVTLLKDLCVHALVYNVPSFASQGWEQQADRCFSVLLLPKHCVLVVYKLPVRLSEPFPFSGYFRSSRPDISPSECRHLTTGL
uniref:Uncharacterized protein n=1 Tax=Timema genevievae TaxID=629358 RepID=A0A7R9K3L7_TIMGE|nr:unnamed protein product [Timema genevievae]